MLFRCVFSAATPIHGLESITETIRNAYNMGPAVLINAGLATIGLRAAVGK